MVQELHTVMEDPILHYLNQRHRDEGGGNSETVMQSGYYSFLSSTNLEAFMMKIQQHVRCDSTLHCGAGI